MFFHGKEENTAFAAWKPHVLIRHPRNSLNLNGNDQAVENVKWKILMACVED